MEDRHAKGIKDLLQWNDEYSCLVTLIDHQHHGILGFINDWYHQVLSSKGNIPQVSQFMADKFGYLERYSRSHLRFEEDMMGLLARDYGFPQDQYQRHLAIHHKFIQEFMGSMAGQLGILTQTTSKGVVDSLAGDVLSGVARWWYGHIKGPTEKLPAGPDHSYRVFLLALPTDVAFDLLNKLLLRASSDLLC